jgi:predicted nucleic acid-binding protein
MFVVDASAVVHALLGTGGGALFDRIAAGDAAAPHLIDAEVLHVLGTLMRSGSVPAVRAQEAAADFQSLALERYDHRPLLSRIWELRQNLTAYDASYVALAELLEVPLLTRDRRLARASGHAASIEYID